MGIIAHFARRTVKRFFPRTALPVRCDGCGANLHKDMRLVAGPGVYLCDACFGRAAAQLVPRRPAADAVRCRFCHRMLPPADVASVGLVVICADCLGAMEEVLSYRKASPHPT
jgi:formylmethanofuran dehydrogenase subunit E